MEACLNSSNFVLGTLYVSIILSTFCLVILKMRYLFMFEGKISVAHEVLNFKEMVEDFGGSLFTPGEKVAQMVVA